MVQVKQNIFTFLPIQTSIFNWTYLRCDWWFIDKSMRVMLHIPAKYWPQYPVYAMPSLLPFKSNISTFIHVQASIFNWKYLRCDWWFVDKSMRVILHISCEILGTISGLRYATSGLRQIQFNYSSWHSGFNIQLNVSPLLLVACRQIEARYTPHLLTNTGNIRRFALRQF
jgi:hypothetical protein